jgi:LacI family transcriptional regulator
MAHVSGKPLQERQDQQIDMIKRITVLDVAKMAHVGASTVSRYLRGIPVRRGAAERIASAVKKLGYVPDEAARALRAGRSRTIGIVLPKVSNVFFSEATQLMEEEARKHGSTVILLTHQDHLEQQYEHLLTLRRYRADGVILTAAPGSDVKQIQDTLPRVPIVAFDSFLSSEIDSVLLRNRESARLATEHLLAHGCKHILCAGAKPEIYSISERIAGYSEALQAVQQKPMLTVAPDYEQLRYALGAALRSKNPPDAILSLSDFATLHVLTTFSELSWSADKPVALVSFDDFGYAPLMNPPLTVIRQPVEKMVCYALSSLFRRIQGNVMEEVQTIALPGELIRRRSCGCI